MHENQFFNTENRDFFTLFTVIPDSLLKNKDSLIQESSHLYKKILTAIGKERENENIDIAYIGQQSDGYNFGLEYTNGRYKGNVTYSLSPNTLLAPNDNVKQRLTGLVGNKYVRHELRKDGLSIVFEVILKDASIMTHKLAERDAIRFLVTYLDNQYREYSTLKIIYIDQYTGEAFRYNVKIDELTLVSR